MSMTIWKYEIPIEDNCPLQLSLPEGATVLSVQVQYGVPCLWVLCEESVPVTMRRFAIRRTGQNADWLDGAKFIGTFQMGAFAFHLFETT